MDCFLCTIMSSSITYWIFSFGIIIYLLYKWTIKNYKYFENKNIKFLKPKPLIGNFGPLIFGKESLYEFAQNIYNSYPNEKVCGLFQFRKPVVLLRNPELIRNITIKDFDHFVDHVTSIDENVDKLFGRNLLSLRGEKWKNMRSKLSPAFTGNKIRHMLKFVNNCAEETVKYYLNENLEIIELKEMFRKFTNDVIATCAFGLEVNSFINKNNEILKIGNEITNFSGIQNLKFLLYTSFPKLMNFFKISFFPKYVLDFFRNLVQGTMKYREENNIYRPDMIHLLMELKQGKLSVDKLKDEIEMKWEDDDLTAQCLLFYLAGFETTTTILCFMAYELAINIDIQQKLIKEIDKVMENKSNDIISYEELQDMKYLEMVINETLRKWPAAPQVDRLCTIPYKLETDDTSLQLNKGDSVIIPILGIHRDSKYFNKPEKFDPERFNEENKNNIKPYTYLPFGLGPRNCIGSRFALMILKIIFINLLKNFTFDVCEKTQIPLKLAKGTFSVTAENGMWINLKPRH